MLDSPTPITGKPSCVHSVPPSSRSLTKRQGTTEEAALDIAAFVTIFFETFSKFQGREFHMSGESYGVCLSLSTSAPIMTLLQGRYLPVFASAVYDAIAKAVAEERTPINLKSVLIGNGLTDAPTYVLVGPCSRY